MRRLDVAFVPWSSRIDTQKEGGKNRVDKHNKKRERE